MGSNEEGMSMKLFFRYCLKALPALIVLAFWASPAMATEEMDKRAEMGNKQDSLRLEPVVVTARKREEQVQEVPISITTISENEIINTGLEDMDKVIMLTPGLFGSLGSQSNASAFNIRGVGTLMPPTGFEDGSVSAYLDGVPIPIGQMDNYILDVERIEVLRGPQGTLYGKSSQAGAINITSAAPSDTFKAKAGLTVGTLGKRGATAMLTGPLIQDKINGRLFINTESKDGQIQNDATGDPLGEVVRLFGRASFDGNWSEEFTTRLNLSLDKLDNGDNIAVDGAGYDRTDTLLDLYEKRQLISMGLINKIDITDNIQLNLVTGFNSVEMDTVTLQTTGFVPEVNDSELHFNQEIRLDGTQGPWEWTTGLFGSHFHRDIKHDVPQLLVEDRGDQTGTNLAVFGETTYALTETLKATGGLRLNYDERTVDETVDNGLLGFSHRMDESKDSINWNGRLALAYTPDDKNTFFGTIGRAYKPAGYSTYHQTAMVLGAMNTPDFDSAISTSFEAGYKGLLFEERFGLDATLFYTMTDGEHVFFMDPLTFTTSLVNIDSRTYGMEIAARALLTEEFTLGGNLALLKTEFTESLDLGLLGDVEEGEELPNAPEYSGLLFAQYRSPLPAIGEGISGFARVDFSFEAERWLDAGHDAKDGKRQIINLNMGVETETVSVIAYVDNLTDEEYFLFALSAGGATAVHPARPREIGLKISVNF